MKLETGANFLPSVIVGYASTIDAPCALAYDTAASIKAPINPRFRNDLST